MTLFGFGEKTIVLTTAMVAIWIVLDARAGVKGISASLVEMEHGYGTGGWQSFAEIYVWAALPEIVAGIRPGCIRVIKGVIIGQLFSIKIPDRKLIAYLPKLLKSEIK